MTDPRELLKRAPVADGHADSLMWNRDLNRASSEGHVDFPRLREAGVRIQAFTIVTRGFPFIGGFPAFAALHRWPRAARAGEWSRCLFQIEQLERSAAASSGAVRVTTSRAALEENLGNGTLSAILGVEGAHALEGRAERVQELWSRGVRFMSLTHLSNNPLGGSSFPLMPPRRLTAYGREVLDEMARVGMSVDVAHASKDTLADVLSHSDARPMCSHSGVRAEGGGWRNLTDDQLRRIADKGGVVGIIFGTVYLGGREMDDVVRHIAHAVDVMGEDGVGLGSDFDGMVPLPRGMRDVRDLHLLVEALQRANMPERRIEKILGGNWRRFFAETLDGSRTLGDSLQLHAYLARCTGPSRRVRLLCLRWRPGGRLLRHHRVSLRRRNGRSGMPGWNLDGAAVPRTRWMRRQRRRRVRHERKRGGRFRAP